MPGTSPMISRVNSESACSAAAPSNGPEQRAHAADDRDQQALHRNGRAIGDMGIEIEEVLRIEDAGQTAEEARQHDRLHLHREGVDAKRARRILIVANGRELRAETRIGHGPYGEEAGKAHRPDDPEEAGRSANWKFAALWFSGTRMPTPAPVKLDRVRQDPQNFRESERHECEIRTAKTIAESRKADECRHRGCRRAPAPCRSMD